MKPEFLMRYFIFSIFAVFFVPCFFILILLTGTFAFTTKAGYIPAGIAFLVFAWPFFWITRSSFRRVKFEFSNLNDLKTILSSKAYTVQSGSADVFASLTSARGQRLDFMVLKSPASVSQQKYSILFTSPKSWFSTFDNVTPLDGEIYFANNKPILFQNGELRFWLDSRASNDRADSQLGKKIEQLSDKIDDARIRGKF